MNNYEKYISYLKMKKAEYNDEAELARETARDFSFFSKEDCPYLIQAIDGVLQELEKKREFYQNQEDDSSFFAMLRDKKDSVDRSIGFDYYYICYDWGHPEAYTPDPWKEACSDIYYLIDVELPIYLSECKPLGYIQGNLDHSIDYDYDMVYAVKKYRGNAVETMSAEDRAEFERIERKVRSMKYLHRKFKVLSHKIDCQSYIYDDEYAGMDFLDEVDYWIDLCNCRHSDPEKAYLFGKALLEGKFSKPLIEQAGEFLFSAAAEGYTEAVYLYGMCCYRGEGGEKVNIDRGIEYFEKAAALGNKQAAEMLELILAGGNDDG